MRQLSRISRNLTIHIFCSLISGYCSLTHDIIPFMAEKTKKAKKKSLHIEIVRQMLTLATSGFGLVAALAWNGVIQEFVNNYIKKWLPDGSGITSLLIYAVAITILAVTVTIQLSKFLDHLEND